MPYLKIHPDTYKLEKNQIYDFNTCQWCGTTAFDLQRITSNYGHLKNIKWKRTCKNCRKTTAVVKS